MAVRRALFQDGRPTKRSRTTINRVVTRAISARQETKLKRTAGVFLSNPTVGTNLELNALSTGPDNGERIGNRIRNLRLTGQLVCVGTGAVRVILYCPKSPQASINTATRFSSIDNTDFWVLHDKVYGTGINTNPTQVITMNLNKKTNFHTFWGSASSNDFQRNPIKCFITSDVQGGTAGTVEGHFNLYYKDS